MSKKTVELGDTVKVNYTGKFDNGEIFDSSVEEKAKNSKNYNPDRKYEPLVVKIGAKQVIEGFEKVLSGMKKGEKKEAKIPPEDAYGHYDSSLLRSMPVSAFKKAGISPQEGQLLNTQVGIGIVTKINASNVDVDFNSPLAGKTLIFEIKVEGIIKEKKS